MMEQLNLFDIEVEQEKPTAVVVEKEEKQPGFQIFDKVKIILIDEEIDSETHHYRKYYEPHVLSKVGEVTRIHKKKANIYTYEVDIYGTKYIFEEAELVWIG